MTTTTDAGLSREDADFDTDEFLPVLSELLDLDGAYRQDMMEVPTVPSDWGEPELSQDPSRGGDREHVLRIVRQAPLELAYAFPELRNDRDVVLVAVVKHGRALRYASEALRSDPELVRLAIQTDFRALNWATQEVLVQHPELILEGFRRWNLCSKQEVLLQFPGALRGDRALITSLIELNPFILGDADPALRDDESLVEVAIRKDGRAFMDASERLRGERRFLELALQDENGGEAIEAASEELRSDESLYRLAVLRGASLKSAPEALRADPDLVRIAMRHLSIELRHAAPSAKTDQSILDAVVAGAREKILGPEEGRTLGRMKGSYQLWTQVELSLLDLPKDVRNRVRRRVRRFWKTVVDANARDVE